MQLSRCAQRCKIMRLFFRSASRLAAAANHSCTLFFHARCSSANVLLPSRIVTVKRGCYDRYRAPFCGFSQDERKPSEGKRDSHLFPLPFGDSSSPTISCSPLDPASDHAYLAFNGRRKFRHPRLLFSGATRRLD